MRSLMLALPAFAISGEALAVQQKLTLESDFRMTRTAKRIGDGSIDRQSSVDKLGTLTYLATNLPHHATVMASLSGELPDYTQEKLKQENGSELNLGNRYPKGHVRMTGSTRASVGLGSSATVGASLSGTLNDTPYRFIGGGIDAMYSLYSQTTFLTFSANAARDNSPASVFLTPGNYFPSRNPTTVDATEVIAGVEQILGERWKASLELSTGRKLQSRPRYFGVKTKTAVALTGSSFLQGNFQYARDTRSQPLKSELGYMSKVQGEAIVTVEPIYDLLVSASYGVAQESVDDTRSGVLLRSRAHQIGTGVDWRLADVSPSLRAAYLIAASDKDTNQFQFGGGLSWSF